MVQKKSLTEEELLKLLESDDIPEDVSIIDLNDPVGDFLSFYDIQAGVHPIKSSDLFKLFKYKYGNIVTFARFSKDISKSFPKRRSGYCLINKDLSHLFTKAPGFKDDTLVRIITEFYNHFEIQKGSELLVEGEILYNLIKFWRKKNRIVGKVLPKSIIETHFHKFFTKKDTKKGVCYVMKSDKLKEFMDEYQKETQKQKK